MENVDVCMENGTGMRWYEWKQQEYEYMIWKMDIMDEEILQYEKRIYGMDMK